jgi:hypothetical protein
MMPKVYIGAFALIAAAEWTLLTIGSATVPRWIPRRPRLA